jgi:undecaprenyl-diphosphatase
MRYRGTAACGTMVVMMVVALLAGARVTHAADQPASKKPVPGKKRVSSTHAKPKKPAVTSAAASDRSDADSRPATPAETQSASEAEQADEPPPAASAPAVTSQPVATLEPVSPVPAVEARSAEPMPAVPQTPVVVDAAPGKISLGQATLLGVVEGLTEYLPVSSTGHLVLAGYWMGLTRQTDERGVFGGHKLEKVPAIDAYEIVIQLGAVLAVLGLYRKRAWQVVQGLMGRNPQGLRLAVLLFAAFLPAAVVGLALHKKIEEHLFGPMPVVLALAVGGVLMIVVEHFFWTRRKDRIHAAAQTRSMMPVGGGRGGAKGPVVTLQVTQRGTSPFTRVDTMLLWQAVAIGAAQCLSLWPGTSRSMVTILAGLVVGLDMVAAAEFSFLLALPTLGAATLYSLAKHHHELMASAGVGGLLVGLIVSGIVAAIAVKAFVHYLTRRGLMPFGVYRIVLSVVLMLYFLR